LIFLNKGKYINITLRFENKFLGTKIGRLKGTHSNQDSTWGMVTEHITIYDMIYLLTAIGLSPGERSTVHIYTQTIRRTIRNKQYIERYETNNT